MVTTTSNKSVYRPFTIYTDDLPDWNPDWNGPKVVTAGTTVKETTIAGLTLTEIYSLKDERDKLREEVRALKQALEGFVGVTI